MTYKTKTKILIVTSNTKTDMAYRYFAVLQKNGIKAQHVTRKIAIRHLTHNTEGWILNGKSR